MTTPQPIAAAPASFVPEQVIAFGAIGTVPTAVEPLHPLPVADQAFRSAIAVTVGIDQVPQRAILIVCTAAGNVALKLADDSSVVVPVATGLSILPFAVKTVLAAGTTAAASYASLG